MPPLPILDINMIDYSNIIATREDIYSLLPHRYEFERLDAIVYEDGEVLEMAGYHDLGEDEFWVRGHIPGRPIFPGVMMIETAAQLLSYFVMKTAEPPSEDAFLGFSAVDGVKFRGSVQPGQRLTMLGKGTDFRKRRFVAYTQGYVEGKMVFEGNVTGMWI